MKKLISLFLCTLMILSLFATAFAVPPEGNDGETLNGASTTQPDTEPTSTHSGSDAHNWILYDSKCNGTMQTWYYRCHCGAHTTEEYRCPGAVHGAACHWLPI